MFAATMPWFLRVCVFAANRSTSLPEAVAAGPRVETARMLIGGASVLTTMLLLPTLVWERRRRRQTEWFMLQTALMVLWLWVFVQWTRAERVMAVQMALAQLFHTIHTAAKSNTYCFEYAAGVYWLAGAATLVLPMAAGMLVPHSEAVDLWLVCALFAGEALGTVVVLVATAVAVCADAYERMWDVMEDKYL